MKKSINLNDAYEDFDNLPPQCVEIEIALLGMLIVDPSNFHMIANVMKPIYFYKQEHSIIYETLLDLYTKEEPTDIIYLVQRLRDNNTLDTVGGAAYITQLTRKILSAANSFRYSLMIVEKYILREIIKIGYVSKQKAFQNGDPFDIIADINSSLTELTEWARLLERKDLSKSIDDVITRIATVHTDELLLQSQWVPFNNTVLDSFALVSENNTLLLGGKSGSGKTRLVIALMRMLLEHNSDNISIKWYSMEDDVEKLVRCFMAPMVGLSDEQMHGKNYKMTEGDIHSLLSYRGTFSKYDIDIVERPRAIIDINMEYKAFVSKRPNRFNILIIDNLMLLNDHSRKENQVKIDDAIAREIYNIRNSCHVNHIKSYIIVLHHFTDEQLDSTSLKTAYRPREKHFKGSTRIRDAATQIMLMNRFSNYPDLIEAYPDQQDILSKLGVLDITKNRNGSTGVLRFFANMPLSSFHFIPDYDKTQ